MRKDAAKQGEKETQSFSITRSFQTINKLHEGPLLRNLVKQREHPNERKARIPCDGH